MKIIYRLLTVAIIVVLNVNAVQAGGWVDDWVSSSTVASPGYFAGSQRGYYNAGSFQARWPGNGTVYPVTVQPPHIKSGCGGIDIFMGGFSFMNAQYLVQKLQAILANAPALAFNLALHTLCTPCENIMAKMEQLSDALNHLQLDACKMSKMAVAQVYTGLGGQDAEQKGLADKSFATETGLTDLFHTVQSNQNASGSSQLTPDASLIASCPPDIVNVFGSPGTVLGNMGAYLGIDQQHIDLARGLFGDIAVIQHANAGGVPVFTFVLIDRCAQNSAEMNTMMDAFVNSVVWSKTIDSSNGGQTCTLVSTTSLTDQVQTHLSTAITKMQNKTSLSTAESDLMERVPLPVYNILKTAITTGSVASAQGSISGAVSKYYVYAMIRDLLDETSNIANTAKQVIDMKGSGSYGSCQYDVFNPGVQQLNTFILPKFKEAVRSLEGTKNQALAEIETNVSLALKFQEYQKQAQSKLSSMFLPSMGNGSR